MRLCLSVRPVPLACLLLLPALLVPVPPHVIMHRFSMSERPAAARDDRREGQSRVSLR